MQLKNFAELNFRVKSLPKKRVVIAAAAQKDLIKLAKTMEEAGLADSLLVGDRDRIQLLADELRIKLQPGQIIDVKEEKPAAAKAVALVRENQADLIMKGQIPTAVFLRAILDKDAGLRGTGFLSQVSVFEKISGDGLQLLSDCAINIAPGLMEKQKILENGVQLARRIGYPRPRVAILAPVETVTADMPETIDAAVLSKMAEREQREDYLVDGPLALDNAVSTEAARSKGIDSPIAGKADLLIVPHILVGNVLHKSLVYFAQKKVAGIVMGAQIPIIMSSRSDSTESKLLSVALAAYLLNVSSY
jgi:phosphate butyryltransferase